MRLRMVTLPQRRNSARPYVSMSDRKKAVNATCTINEQNEHLHAMHLHAEACVAAITCIVLLQSHLVATITSRSTESDLDNSKHN